MKNKSRAEYSACKKLYGDLNDCLTNSNASVAIATIGDYCLRLGIDENIADSFFQKYCINSSE